MKNGIEKIIYQTLKNKNISISPTKKWHSRLIEIALKEKILQRELLPFPAPLDATIYFLYH
jgi:hypothetical protein